MTQTTQASFAAPLLDRTLPPPSGLASWTGAEPVTRYGVYRNNVATGLARALAARFPVTEKIVGEEFFTAMARDYVLLHPPSSPVLLHYGHGFADFVAGFAPAASLPYLADIVRLEDAQVQAYHAQDISPIDARVITRIAPDRLANVTFVKGSATDPNLPEAQVDVALVLDVYHHFDYPEKMLATIAKSLKPEGRLVIVEYYKRPEAMPNNRAMTHIRIDMPDVIKEVEANQFHLVSEKETIKNVQYMLVLEKKAAK